MDTESTFGVYEILAILGALAWLPQLVIFISKKISKPKLTVIPDKEVEIGFTSFGPIFNIQIAFLAENKKALIKKAKIELTHENNDTQKFTWDWFEETLHEVSVPNSGLIPTRKNQKAIAINIEADSLVEKKIGFHLNSFKEDRLKLVQLTTEEYLNIHNAGDDINQIRTRNTFNNLKDLYKNSFNWKVGNYKAKIITELSDSQKFESTVSFQLTSLNIKSLELNINIAQQIVEKEYGAEIDAENNWFWVNSIVKTE